MKNTRWSIYEVKYATPDGNTNKVTLNTMQVQGEELTMKEALEKAQIDLNRQVMSRIITRYEIVGIEKMIWKLV